MTEPNREAERGTGSAATMNVTVITCARCGKAVTPAIPWPSGEPLAVRAWVECPECARKSKSELEAQLAEANRERERANMLAQDLIAQLQQRLDVAGAQLAEKNRIIREHEAAAVRLCGQVDDAVARLVTAEARAEAADSKRKTLCSLLKTEVAARDEAWAEIDRLTNVLTRIRDERGVRPYDVAREALRPDRGAADAEREI